MPHVDNSTLTLYNDVIHHICGLYWTWELLNWFPCFVIFPIFRIIERLTTIEFHFQMWQVSSQLSYWTYQLISNCNSWWRHQMETFSALLALCAHKGQWRGAFMFSLICAWTKCWANNGDACDLRRHCVHYNVILMYYEDRVPVYERHWEYQDRNPSNCCQGACPIISRKIYVIDNFYKLWINAWFLVLHSRYSVVSSVMK